MNKFALLSSASAMLLASLSATGASAQDAAQDQDAVAAEEIVITGSRRAARSPADAPSPVDVISAEQFQNQGDADIGNLLRTLVPSYNVRTESISDAATLVRPANLRGLPADSTLILLNGKRRHRGAVISFLGGGVSDGAQGPDVGVIPAIALERVDVLRDGAAAQYGADAIAGVINFVLKDDAEGGSFEVKYGSTYEGDGDNYLFAGNLGLPVTDDGFINLSFEYRETDETVRAVQRDDAQGLIDAGNTAVRQPFAQTFGSPNVDDDYKLFFNFGVQASDVAEIYAFGNYAQRDVDGGFFYRNPDDRTGVFDDGTGVRLVQDLTPDDGITCPVVTVADGPAALQALIDDPNCFVFNELFPGGFTPRFGGRLNDIAATGGVRGEFDSGLSYDISAGAGRNEVDFFINNTVNAALGAASPTNFEIGSYVQLEKQFNIDLSYPIDLDYFASPLNVAAGFEWREEQFEIKTGQPESFAADLAPQGFSPGSNGFPGFGPNIAGEFDRKNIAFYIDLEADVTEDLVLGVAGRVEDFTDFGTTTNGKFSALYNVTDFFKIRGTYATGFRAPTPGQSNVTNVTTVFEQGELINRGTIPPTTPLAQNFGGQQLQPEQSRSFTVGTALDIGDLSVTVDFFRIKVEDRIAQSASISLTADQAAQLEAQGIDGASDFRAFRFFTNDFSSRTRGIDIVATYPLDLFGGDTDIAFTGNWTDTEVDIGDISSDAQRIRQIQLEDTVPEIRGNLTLTHYQDWFRGLFRLNYFGDYTEIHLEELDFLFNPGSEVTADIEVGATIWEGFEISAGVSNLFDNFPDENPFQGEVGQRYAENSPFGINGGSWYIRARYSF